MFYRILFVFVLLMSFFIVSCTAFADTGHPVKAYFTPINATQFDTVVGVNRVSPTLAVGTYAVEQVAAGPTLAESKTLFSQLHNNINGPSACAGKNAAGGSDFTLNIASGKATIRFCRLISSAGIGDDARITAEVSKTLLQFSAVKKVVILSKDGTCFGDMSGMNRCLK